MSDPRTREEKKEAKMLADVLRRFADVLENSRILDEEINIHADHETICLDGEHNHHYANGVQDYTINFRIYNPEADGAAKRLDSLEDAEFQENKTNKKAD